MSANAGADWTVVTVTHNSARVLEAFWATARLGSATWVVVDNDSSDDSVDVARRLGAHVLGTGANAGFSVANNLGLRASSTEWVAFVNPDVTIPDADGFARLAAISRGTGGLVAPQLLNPDGTEQPNARGLPYPTAKLSNRGVRLPWVDESAYARVGLRRPTYVAWVMGAAYAGRADLIRELGGWDERFFLYYEDHDLGLRSWLAGHPVVLDPAVRWVHGWKRATTRLELAPWRHELRSARMFYRIHPSLLTSVTAARDPALQRLREHLWREVPDAWGR